jgi:putative peptide zinc metalloprotease protein
VGAGLFFIHWPYRISAPAVVQPQGARDVYVSVPGTLVESVAESQAVEPGDLLARLENHDVRQEVEKLRGRRNQLQLRLQTLESRRISDDSAAAQIPATSERLADIDKRLRRRESDERELTLTAPIAGRVLVPPSMVSRQPPGELASWSGNPLDERNLGSYLETGTLLCRVGDPQRTEAVLIIDQTDVEFVRRGQRVRIQFNHLPGTALAGTILEVAEIDLKVAPRDLIDHEDLPTRTDGSGVRRLLSTAYQARVRFDKHAQPLFIGAQGRAKIDVAPRSLYDRLSRYLSRTFHFEL